MFDYSNNKKLIHVGNKFKDTKGLLLKYKQISTEHENNVVGSDFTFLILFILKHNSKCELSCHFQFLNGFLI